MESFKLIEFHRTRDFSNKLNATFSFVIQNFKSLFKSLLFIAGPPVLIASLLLSSFISDFFSLGIQSGRGDPEALTGYFTSVNFWLSVAFAFVFFVVSIVVTTATVYNYLILYGEKKSNQIEVSEVWERVRNTFWMYLGTTLLIGLLAIAVYMVLIIPMFVLGAISPFLIFFGVIIFMGGIVYFSVSISLVYVVRAFESNGFFESLARSMKLIRGKWWSTFGLWMLLSMSVGVVSSLFFIPAYVIMIMQSLHNLQPNDFQEPSAMMNTIVLVFMTLYYLSQMVLSCIPSVGLAFQYFNLVEMKEAKGLMNQIESFGQPPPAPGQEEHY